MEEKEFQKEMEKCANSVAAEFYYFKELQEDLMQLQEDCKNTLKKKELKDIKHALRDFRYISRAAYREERYGTDLQPHLNNLINKHTKSSKFNGIYRRTISEKKQSYSKTAKPQVSDIEVKELLEFMGGVKIATEKNIQLTSRFEGSLRKKLYELYALVESEKDPLSKIKEVLSDVQSLIKWLSGAVINFKKAEKNINRSKKLKELAQFTEQKPEAYSEFTSLDINIQKTENPQLPSIKKIYKFGNYKCQIIVKFNQGYNPNETGDILNQLIRLLAYVNPAQGWLPFNKTKDYEKEHSFIVNKENKYLLKNLKNPLFRDVERFHKLFINEIYQMMKVLIKNNKEELMVVPEDMVFEVNIYGTEMNQPPYNAITRFEENLAINEKKIDLGNLFAFVNFVYTKDLFSPIDNRFLYNIQPTIYELSRNNLIGPQITQALLKKSKALYPGGLYRNETVYTTTYHEFMHTLDPFLGRHQTYKHSIGIRNLKIVQQILPNVMKRIYKENLIIHQAEIDTLSDIFTRSRAEALTVFSEFFVKKDIGDYYMNSFITTLPLKENYERIMRYFKGLEKSLSSISITTSNPQAFTYEIGYMMAIIITIAQLFKKGVDCLIVPGKELVYIGREKFPISLGYLTAGSHELEVQHDFKGREIDAQLFNALKRNDVDTIKELLVEAGVSIVNRRNFRKYYNKFWELGIYKFEKKYVLEIIQMIRESELALVNLFKEACDYLKIPCILDKNAIGNIFYESAKEFDKEFRKKKM